MNSANRKPQGTSIFFVRTIPVCVVFIVLSSVSEFVIAADCEPEDFRDIAAIRSVPEADFSPANYPRNAFRSHLVVARFLGDRFQSFLESLPNGAKIFDSGGGYSVYGFDYASRGYNVTTVNAQDFFGENIFSLADPDKVRAVIPSTMQAGYSFSGKIGNVPADVLFEIAKFNNVEFPKYLIPIDGAPGEFFVKAGTSKESLVEDLSQFMARLSTAIQGNPNLSRRTALVQDALPTIDNGSQDLIIDIWGAFAYSSDRLKLLYDFQSKLSKEGRAFIYIGSNEDKIVLSNGSNVPLLNFLVANFPTTFQLAKDSSGALNTLVVRGGQLPVDFVEKFESRIVPNQFGAANTPTVEYRLRSP